MSRRLLHLLKWPVALALCAGLVVAAFLVRGGQRDRPEQEKARKPTDNPGEITLKAKIAADYEVVPARPVVGWSEPVTVYGRVVPNPQTTFEVRAPFAGRLRKGSADWPVPGRPVKAGAVLGWVDVRVDPQVRLDLRNKQNEAEIQLAAAARTNKILEARLKRLQAAPLSVSPRELEEAQVQTEEARTREATARAAVKLWKDALEQIDLSPRQNSSPWTRPLKAPADGEVIELLAQPGAAVEAGGLVARVADLRRLLVRLDLPRDVAANGPPSPVQVEAGQAPPPALRGARNRPLSSAGGKKVPARFVSRAAQLDPSSQRAGCFYEIDAAKNDLAWRPGLFVKAELKTAARPDTPSPEAVAVPAAALLYHQGRALVYTRTSKDEKTATFRRCEVRVLGRENNHWILAVSQDIAPGVEVVAGNAQALLSEEFNKDTDD